MDCMYVTSFVDSKICSRYEYSGVRALIGRGKECDVLLSNPIVSRRHALLIRRGKEVFVRDLGSRNGVTLNGLLIQQDAAVSCDSTIAIGPYLLRISNTKDGPTDSSDFCFCSTQIEGQNESLAGDESIALTAAQTRVFQCFVRGLSEKEVAAELHIRPSTVHDHAKAIYRAYRVCTRGELLARWADEQLRFNRVQ